MLNIFKNDNNEKNSIKYILEVLEDFKINKNPKFLPVLFRSVLLKSDEVKIHVIREIKEYLIEVDKTDYYYIDYIFRENMGAQYEVLTRKVIQIEDLNSVGLTKEERVILLGLGTFHHDGWLRVAALKELLKYDTELKVPFIIVRSCDWVSNIRDISKNEIDNLISNNIKTVLECIPLIERLKSSSRFNYKEAIEKIDIQLKDEDILNYVSYIENCKDKSLREFFLIRIANLGSLDIKEKIRIIKSEDIPTVRLRAINILLENISKEELKIYKCVLLKDNFPKIKSNILYKLYIFNLLNYVDFIIPYTMDNNNSIREDARFYIRKLMRFDFKELYKRNLPAKGAILGLCDIATKNELDIIKKVLINSKGKVAKKIITTLGSIDADECKDILYQALISCNKKHSNESRKVSLKYKISYDVEKVYNVFKTTNYEHVKINLTYILCSYNKWIAIQYILECHESEKDKIVEIGRDALKKWILAFNYNYDKPSEKQLYIIKENIDKYQNYIPKEQLKLLNFLVK